MSGPGFTLPCEGIDIPVMVNVFNDLCPVRQLISIWSELLCIWVEVEKCFFSLFFNLDFYCTVRVAWSINWCPCYGCRHGVLQNLHEGRVVNIVCIINLSRVTMRISNLAVCDWDCIYIDGGIAGVLSTGHDHLTTE